MLSNAKHLLAMVGSMLCHAEQGEASPRWQCTINAGRRWSALRRFFTSFRMTAQGIITINTINTTPTPCYCVTMLLCYSERTPPRAGRTSAHGINIGVYSHYYTPLHDHLNGYINNHISIYGSIGAGVVLSPYCPYYSLLSAQYAVSKHSEY